MQERPKAQDLLDDGRGDVVRQIAGDGDWPPLGEVGLQDVGVENRKTGVTAEFLMQVMHENLVKLDSDQLFDLRQQVLCESAAAWADLEDRIGCGNRRNTFEDRRPGEEVLAEAAGH